MSEGCRLSYAVNQYAGKDTEKVEQILIENITKYIRDWQKKPVVSEQCLYHSLIAAAKIGMMNDGVITDRESEVLHRIFDNEGIKIPFQKSMNSISKAVAKKDLEIISAIADCGKDSDVLTADYLKVILGFCYVDDSLNDNTTDILKKMFIDFRSDTESAVEAGKPKRRKSSNKNDGVTETKENGSRTAKTEIKKEKPKMPEHAHFNITEDIDSLKKYIYRFSRELRSEMTRTAAVIKGNTPITRKTDRRLKLISENSQLIFDEYISTLEKVMLKLDEKAEKLWQDNTDDESIKEIMKLIGKCKEYLKADVTIDLGLTEKIYKHKPDSKYTKLAGKWKQRYDSLPSVKREALDEKLEERKMASVEVQNRLLCLVKEKEMILDDLKMQEERVFTLNDTLMRAEKENESSSETARERIKQIEITVNDNREKLLELNGKINVLEERKNIRIITLSEQVDEIDSRLKELEAERVLLLNDEESKKEKYDRSFFFRSGKKTAYEESLKKRLEKDEEIKELTKQKVSYEKEVSELKIAGPNGSEISKELYELSCQKTRLENENSILAGEKESLNNELNDLQNLTVKYRNSLAEGEELLKQRTEALKQRESEILGLEEKVNEVNELLKETEEMISGLSNKPKEKK